MLLAALLVSIALAGCGGGLPEGADGDLVDDWAGVAEVKGFEPQLGQCLQSPPPYRGSRLDAVVPCGEYHYAEIVHVGEFPVDVKPGLALAEHAYGECDAKARQYVGRPWWEGRLRLGVTVPSKAASEGGARWFWCDLAELLRLDRDDSWTPRKGSLKDGIPAELRVDCANGVLKGGHVDSMSQVACAVAHNAEYVGYFRATAVTPYPTSDRQWHALQRMCGEVAAGYVGVGKDQLFRLPTVAWPADPDSWAYGDRRVRCVLLFDRTLKRSVKGTRGKGVPGW